MPLNQPEDVAKMILQSAADSNMNGKAIYVAGGRGFDTEEGYDKTLPQWMGEENAKTWLKGQEVLGLVSDSVVRGNSTDSRSRRRLDVKRSTPLECMVSQPPT